MFTTKNTNNNETYRQEEGVSHRGRSKENEEKDTEIVDNDGIGGVAEWQSMSKTARYCAYMVDDRR